MEAMRPEFVFLDLGNVILNFDRGHAYRRMAEVSGAGIGSIAPAVEASGLMERLERGRIDWKAFSEEFSRRTGTTSDPQELADAYSDMFTLSAGMLPVIAGLERARVRFGLLSNTSAVHWAHVSASRYGILSDRFDPLVLSHETGWIKPERGIFDHAAAAAGVEPRGIFFCDDMPMHVDAARSAGWDAEVFTGAVDLAAQLERRGIDLGI